MATPRPTKLTLHKVSKRLEVAFDDGASFDLPAEYLRVFSPSAEARGHGGGSSGLPSILIMDKDEVAITAMDPVGHYAVRLVFDDGHDSGIYTWAILRELGEMQQENWKAYLARLAEAGRPRKGNPTVYTP